MKRTIKSVLVGAGLGGLAAVGTVVPAQAAVTNLQIVDVDRYRGMTVCKDWHQTRGNDYNRICEASVTGTLNYGENSIVKFQWRDTDAVRITAGRSLKWDKAGPNVVLWSCSEVRATGYYKVSPPLSLSGDRTMRLYYKNC